MEGTKFPSRLGRSPAIAENLRQQSVSQMRSGSGYPLEAAVETLKDFVDRMFDDAATQRTSIDQAAEKIRQLSRLTAPE
jgi:hypothetical protein